MARAPARKGVVKILCLISSHTCHWRVLQKVNCFGVAERQDQNDTERYNIRAQIPFKSPVPYWMVLHIYNVNFTYIHINHLKIKTLWKAFVPCCWDHELSIEIPKVTEVRSNQARKSAIKLSNRDYLPKHSGYTKYYEKKKKRKGLD